MKNKILPYVIAGGISLFGANNGASADVEVDPYVDYLNLKEVCVQTQTNLTECETNYGDLERNFHETVQHYESLIREYQVIVSTMDSTVNVLEDSLGSLEQKLSAETELREKAENKKFLGIF